MSPTHFALANLSRSFLIKSHPSNLSLPETVVAFQCQKAPEKETPEFKTVVLDHAFQHDSHVFSLCQLKNSEWSTQQKTFDFASFHEQPVHFIPIH